MECDHCREYGNVLDLDSLAIYEMLSLLENRIAENKLLLPPVHSSEKEALEGQGDRDFCLTKYQSNYKIVVNDKVGTRFLRENKAHFFLPFAQGNMKI